MLTFKIRQNEQRPLKVGSTALPTESQSHPSYEAVVDNFVYIHNAFRNDLTRIIDACEKRQFVRSEFEDWASFLEVHSRFEDEVVVVALQARMAKSEANESLPSELTSGSDHDSVKSLIELVLKCEDDDERLELLKKLAAELDGHLNREEELIAPLLLQYFSLRELWAMDSFVINPKLTYAGDKETLMKITKWWFYNISISEAWPLLKNFIKAGKQSPMPLEEWKKFQDDVPALAKFDTEDLVP